MISRSLRGLVAATVLVAGVATVAEAQMETPSRFGIKAGVALPMGDFGDAAGLGIHAGAHLGFGMTENLGLRFDVDYGYYSGDAAGLDNVTLLEGDTREHLRALAGRGRVLYWLDAHWSGGARKRRASSTRIAQSLPAAKTSRSSSSSGHSSPRP